RHHGLRSVGVLWGFGGEQELTEAGAGQLARDPAQLLALLA
ncbi:HAD family hydrolase, partial [Stenotrophomonas sp. HMWF022]